MAKIATRVEGVYERVPGSGLWHARYRQDGKLVRKSFGRNRNAAIAYVDEGRDGVLYFDGHCLGTL
jgi:hypothetical protein